MLEHIVDIPTLMICTALSTAVVGIFFIPLLLRNPHEPGVGYWCATMWVVTAGCTLLMLRNIAVPAVSLGIGNLFVLIGYALTWAGFRHFDGRRVSAIGLAIGPAVWFCFYFLTPFFSADVNLRIILVSCIVIFYSTLIVREARAGAHDEPLPTRGIVAWFFSVHAAVHLLRIILSIAFPARALDGQILSAWFSFVSLEVFAHTLITCVAIISLFKERSEYRYRQAARIDGLTGIRNRVSFMDEGSRCLQTGGPGNCLFLLDLDHFKAINDTYGHPGGDAALIAFSRILQKHLRPGMIFGRIGGEEFGVLAPGMDARMAVGFADDLLDAVSTLSILHQGKRIRVSVSIGVSVAEGPNASLSRLMNDADVALYRAKRGGRNRVTFFSETEGEEQKDLFQSFVDAGHSGRYQEALPHSRS